MSKIICDICGTSYSDSGKQCPVCGCARPAAAQHVSSDTGADGASGYTHVKGGRFSKSNVKKRNSGSRAADRSKSSASGRRPASRRDDKNEGKSGKGLLIVAVLLLLAIIAVVAYLVISVFFPTLFAPGTPTEPTGPSISEPTVNPGKACTDINLDITELTFTEAGEARLLWVTVTPSDTTDVVTYRSEDESVATVNETGKIVAVSAGSTKIIVTCGSVVKECIVVCDFAELTEPTNPSTEPTDPSTEPTEPELEVNMNRSDITFSFKGEAWYIYNGTVPRDQVTWRSDDDTIAVIENGKVTAVGSGTTRVYAEFEDQSISCIIRCAFKDEDGPIGGNGGAGEDGGEVTVTYAIYTYYGYQATDITINVDETQKLYLSDGNGHTVEATWEAASDLIRVEDNAITGVSSGTTSVTATYEGKTYKCIIRVR